MNYINLYYRIILMRFKINYYKWRDQKEKLNAILFTESRENQILWY